MSAGMLRLGARIEKVFRIRARCPVRGCQTAVADLTKVSLSEELPGLPQVTYAKPSPHDDESKVTTLENGIRVASQNRFGHFSTVGVVIDSGPRYEVAFRSGISHFLEKLAFGSTSRFQNRDEVLQVLEGQGGICDCQTSRDTMIYAASADPRGLDSVIELLSEVTLRPQVTDEELFFARQAIECELRDADMKPDQETLLTEMIHKAAFNNNTLGLPKLCPEENIPLIDQKMIFTFLKQRFTPERMVVAGVGIDHDRLVECVQKNFVEKKPIWVENPSLVGDPSLETDESVSQYTGGIVKVSKDLSKMSLGPTPIPNLAHFMLALESASHRDPEFITYCVLNILMGGGGSFSAGGPGKGMYSRLYTNVLNRYHWMFNATAYNHAYNDSGIFCIHASADPSALGELVEIIVNEFAIMVGRISIVELERAKKQLQSMLLMNLEQRPVLFEDIGRQVLSVGKRRNAAHYIDAINKINEEDIHRAAQRMLRTRASIAALGDLQRLPALDEVETGLANPQTKRGKRFSLFR
ncbi:mitochondrial-processing peptidase subunit alpha [Galendromus occidentalis]|uniref:Mitochondrial-processing peptidase subunit alpha n=1 Tax=Galendromus occidentalis TaxID=34638 RepID=A0AAJ6QT94_9ACAR|nr:mitochondrial-processing peptidase subunit alpha [Galendromus occidentalis]